MASREFRFEDGTSKKFWTIDLDGPSHTVVFGRIGTDGQTQTKKFGSEADAKKSYDKLVAEKVKKGYVETTPAKPAGGAAATPAVKKPAGAKAAVKEPAASTAAAPVATSAAPVSLSVQPRVDEPAGARKWNYDPAEIPTYRPRPTPEPFNLESCLRRLVRGDGRRKDWLWDTEDFPTVMSPAEAHFWLEAMFEARDSLFFDEKADKRVVKVLKGMAFTGKVTPAEFIERYEALEDRSISHLAYPLHYLFSTEQLITLYTRRWGVGMSNAFYYVVLPYLDEAERERYRKLLRPHLGPKFWPRDRGNSPDVFDIAMYLGMRDELRRVVLSWPDGAGATYDGDVPIDTSMVYFIGDDAFIAEQIRRLGIPIYGAEAVRQWVYVTGPSGLDVVKPLIMDCTGKADATKYIEAFGAVKAPQVAADMIEFLVSSKAPKAAKDWLEENLAFSIPGVMPVAAGKGKLADAAIDFLRGAKRHGQEAAIREALKAAPAAVERVTREVLDYSEKTYEPLDDKSTPKALAAAVAAVPSRKGKPSGVDVTALPAVLAGERRLNDEQVAALLAVLREGKSDAPLIEALKEQATRESLDTFIWSIFEAWLLEGAPPKEKWKMIALGLLGSDAVALKLTPLIRQWPGENQHARAVVGLECLRAMGSDTALMCLNGIAQKLKFQGLKNKAKELMEAIAKDKGLKREELEDRIVPDCELDERGTRIFDFGPRQFRLVLGPELKPMVKDAEDKLRPDLPAPTSKDDSKKAAAAVEEWKLLKKQVREVAKLQALRLEQAMVTGRRWSPEQFKLLLVDHPLMTNLARLLIWAGYDKTGNVACTFRVSDEREILDSADKPISLKTIAAVGIPHPLELEDEDMTAWGQVLGDYEIIPPFDQLGRAVHGLEKAEIGEDSLDRFGKLQVPGASLAGGLDRNGWVRGDLQDHGDFHYHTKVFTAAGIVAVVEYDPGLWVGGMAEAEDQEITDCYFFKGNENREEPSEKNRLKLGKVPPLVISEVLRDLTALSAKAVTE
jgi:predicted DNA-binding WGR domain protein